MKLLRRDWRTIVFDCDGVLLDSNAVKSQAFYNTVLPFGARAAEEFVAFHREHGGVSRYKKFEYFIETIAPRHGWHLARHVLAELLADYASKVHCGLLECAATSSLKELRSATRATTWLVVSGGDQSEVRNILEQREMAAFFDGGIFGSPDDKDCILNRELQPGCMPGLFIGDSRYDWEVSKRHGLQFVFAMDWSEWKEGQALAASGAFPCVATLAGLMKD